MSRFRPWAFKRRLLYGAPPVTLATLIIAVIVIVNVYVAPTCSDGVQNGDERGVDCGGGCIKICVAEAQPPRVQWAESFMIVPGQYNAVAYIENRNPSAATDNLRYTFRMYSDSTMVAERSGVTNLPPNSTYPIFEGRIFTDQSLPVTRTELTLEPLEYWWPATIGREQFRTIDQVLKGADARPRLEVALENVLIADAEEVEIVATIFDGAGNPLTASRTFVDALPGRSTTDVVLTWPEPISQTVRSCEIPTDVLLTIDRSGSMAADGGSPPEPLESAKRAAQSFLRELRPTDQVAVLSYATTPSDPLEQTLTTNTMNAFAAIGSITMGSDGVQYTDMGAAFRAAIQELRGPRQREDARKVLVFMTDGDVTRPVNPETGERDVAYATEYAITAAEEAKAAGILVYAIGFGSEFGALGSDIDRNVDLIRAIASSPETSFIAPTLADLAQVYQAIGVGICDASPARIDVVAKTTTNFRTE